MTSTEQDINEAPGASAPGEARGEAEPKPVESAEREPEQATQAAGGEEQVVPSEDGDAAAIEGELGELVRTAAQRDEYLALAQRTQADFENDRKRVARDAASAQDRGVAKLAKELLPALDNLDRAIEAACTDVQDGGASDPLLAGVRLVRSELAAALARMGIESFAPLGETFDPNHHEAMAQQPVDGAASGTVAEVYQNGYRMGEAIIRPARVLVAA